jgi:hypothetical protein
MKRLVQALMLVSFVGVKIFFPEIAKACTCQEDYTPPCAAYWRADAVFIGTASEIAAAREESKANPHLASIHFQVAKSFKGVADKQVTIDVSVDSCYHGYDLKVGGEYLVYAYKNSVTGRLELRPCSRTGLLANSAEDLNYIDQLIQKKPPQSISGMLGGSFKNLSGAKVIVKGDGINLEVPFDARMRYSVNLPQPGTFKVQLILPFNVEPFSGSGISVISKSSQTILEYTVALAENQCDYREMRVMQVSKSESGHSLQSNREDAACKP